VPATDDGPGCVPCEARPMKRVLRERYLVRRCSSKTFAALPPVKRSAAIVVLLSQYVCNLCQIQGRVNERSNDAYPRTYVREMSAVFRNLGHPPAAHSCMFAHMRRLPHCVQHDRRAPGAYMYWLRAFVH